MCGVFQSKVVIEQHEPAQEVRQEHKYLVYRHLAPVASGCLDSKLSKLTGVGFIRNLQLYYTAEDLRKAQ